MPSTSGKITLSVRVTEELDAWVREQAGLGGLSMSSVVEQALKDAKERQQ